jgi:hypothetical protein
LDRPFQDLIAQSEKTLKEKTPVFNAVGYLKVFFVILLAASFVWLFFNDFPFILILAWFILRARWPRFGFITISYTGKSTITKEPWKSISGT